MQAQFKGPHTDWIRSVHFEIQVPRVLRLLHYDRVPKQRVQRPWHLIDDFQPDALRMENPDSLCVGEKRGREAHAVTKDDCLMFFGP